MARCRSCDAEIFWATSQTGKAMPVDARPNLSGNIRIYGRPAGASAVVLAGGDLVAARADGVDLYMPHHATCPQGRAWRKKR